MKRIMRKDAMECYCGGVAEYTKDLRLNRFDIDGWKCLACKEEYYNPIKAEKIFLLNKLKMSKYSLKLSQVRSNLILRIPKDVSTALDLKKGDSVRFYINEKNDIVISAKG